MSAAAWTWSDTEVVRWQRGSRRQDQWIGMQGVLGRLHVEADRATLHCIAPLLRLGALTHVGADAAFGCGRYRIDETGV